MVKQALLRSMVAPVFAASAFHGTAQQLTGLPADSQFTRDGGKNYKLGLPPNIPMKDFWSVIRCSNQTPSMTQTDQRFPSASS